MDQLQISPETQQGLQNLSAKDKQELNQFIVGETQKAQVQSSMSRPYPCTAAPCASGI
jgi:import inner membrane translocase subunit TIM8